MHKLLTSFVLGYHGCDREVGEAILAGDSLKESRNDYDWLGWGVYFWESNPLRGLEFAQELQQRRRGAFGPVLQPCVIGAVVDLGHCLDLMSSHGLRTVEAFHDDFVETCRAASTPMPRNQGGEDLLLRKLDCAVINHLHNRREALGLPSFDTVRGVFTEGGPIVSIRPGPPCGAL